MAPSFPEGASPIQLIPLLCSDSPSCCVRAEIGDSNCTPAPTGRAVDCHSATGFGSKNQPCPLNSAWNEGHARVLVYRSGARPHSRPVTPFAVEEGLVAGSGGVCYAAVPTKLSRGMRSFSKKARSCKQAFLVTSQSQGGIKASLTRRALILPACFSAWARS